MSDRVAMFLIPEEVEVLTGFKAPGHQCRWLCDKGWRFVLSGSGRPIIARKYAEKMLGCGEDDGTTRPIRPNFNALRAA